MIKCIIYLWVHSTDDDFVVMVIWVESNDCFFNRGNLSMGTVLVFVNYNSPIFIPNTCDTKLREYYNNTESLLIRKYVELQISVVNKLCDFRDGLANHEKYYSRKSNKRTLSMHVVTHSQKLLSRKLVFCKK